MTSNTSARPAARLDDPTAFTLTGILTGLTATAAVAVLCAFVASKALQHGMRQAGSAVSQIESAAARSLDSLGIQDAGATEAGTSLPGPDMPAVTYLQAEASCSPCWPWPQTQWLVCRDSQAWRCCDRPGFRWLRPMRLISGAPRRTPIPRCGIGQYGRFFHGFLR